MKLIRRIILATCCCCCCLRFECLQACLRRQQTATVAIYDPRSSICLNFIGIFVWTWSCWSFSLLPRGFLFSVFVFLPYLLFKIVLLLLLAALFNVCCFSSRVCRVWSGQPTWKALQQRRHENSSNKQMMQMQVKKKWETTTVAALAALAALAAMKIMKIIALLHCCSGTSNCCIQLGEHATVLCIC